MFHMYKNIYYTEQFVYKQKAKRLLKKKKKDVTS